MRHKADSAYKLAALRAVINYDIVNETFRPNALADHYQTPMSVIQKYSPELHGPSVK